MKYGKYLEAKRKSEWRDHYIDYRGLKDLIKVCACSQRAVPISTTVSGPTAFIVWSCS